MKRVISIYLPMWPTDRLRNVSGSPARDKPYVTAIKDGNQRVIASVDAAARKLKLNVGDTIAYAQAVVAHLEIAEADETADLAALKAIALKCLQLYSPIVAVSPPNTIWMDIRGCSHLYGSEEKLALDLLNRLAAKNICAKAAIADTSGASYAIAHYGKQRLAIIPPGKQRECIKELPIAGLRLTEKVAGALEGLGFYRIGQLYGKPRGPIVKRFGLATLQRLDQALGDLSEPLTPIEAPELIRERCNFTDAAANPDFIAGAIGETAARLCQQLQERKLGARRLDLVFHRVDNTLQAIRVGTVSASHDAKHLIRLFREHLDKVDYGFGIEYLTLSAPLVEPFRAQQYTNEFGAANEADLSGLIDVLNGRLGAKHVFQTKAVESDVPERSVRKILPLSGKGNNAWPKNLPRPTRILRQPEKIEAMALLPDHAPVQFVWRSQRYRIKRSDGPERIFGEWWAKDNAETVAVRDYFQVEDEQGGRYWLFRRGDGVDPRTGNHEWFLHGFFR